MIEYYNPVETNFGIGKLEEIAEVADKYSKRKKVLVVTGKKAMRTQGITQRVEELLSSKGYDVDMYEKVGSNPTLEIVDEGTKLVRTREYGLIVGLGGGSAMDCAKCMAILGKHEGNVIDYLKKEKFLQYEGVPLVEIATTAGTGSEVTMWATVWDMKKKKKYSLSDKKMYAKAAIIDPELMLGLSPKLTAITGMDAFCQAIEAYWSRNHNPISDQHALKAIRLLSNNLLKLYNNPKNLELRKKVSLGSLESGLAFSNTKTTAVHSTSYPITANFGIPHGHACALTLAAFLEYNSHKENNIPEGPERVLKIAETLDCETIDQAARSIEDMMIKMNLKIRLSELGIDKKGIELIVRDGFNPDRVKHNPRQVTEKSLLRILKKIS